ncbi:MULTISPECIES: hypothetical protein [Pseudomonas]|uniref:hypothetical protein n=1 Tax=Pseudomonas TaxID=286 RepID=UPI001482C996|nr:MULTISPECIES: hypothetical protein [Pseudomonas]MCX4221017.1 hypothetical protein [Pseudomonas sp. MCal1]UDI94172.1 hypothetical protein I5961_06440 [Pseudomonas sp. IAC-BECa141]UIN52472.1 hypothetical protein LXN51_15825 [Pseudomonas kribbensis]
MKHLTGSSTNACLDRQRCYREDGRDFHVAGGYGTRLKLTQHQFPVSASALAVHEQ